MAISSNSAIIVQNLKNSGNDAIPNVLSVLGYCNPSTNTDTTDFTVDAMDLAGDNTTCTLYFLDTNPYASVLQALVDSASVGGTITSTNQNDVTATGEFESVDDGTIIYNDEDYAYAIVWSITSGNGVTWFNGYLPDDEFTPNLTYQIEDAQTIAEEYVEQLQVAGYSTQPYPQLKTYEYFIQDLSTLTQLVPD